MCLVASIAMISTILISHQSYIFLPIAINFVALSLNWKSTAFKFAVFCLIYFGGALLMCVATLKLGGVLAESFLGTGEIRSVRITHLMPNVTEGILMRNSFLLLNQQLVSYVVVFSLIITGVLLLIRRTNLFFSGVIFLLVMLIVAYNPLLMSSDFNNSRFQETLLIPLLISGVLFVHGIHEQSDQAFKSITPVGMFYLALMFAVAAGLCLWTGASLFILIGALAWTVFVLTVGSIALGYSLSVAFPIVLTGMLALFCYVDSLNNLEARRRLTSLDEDSVYQIIDIVMSERSNSNEVKLQFGKKPGNNFTYYYSTLRGYSWADLIERRLEGIRGIASIDFVDFEHCTRHLSHKSGTIRSSKLDNGDTLICIY